MAASEENSALFPIFILLCFYFFIQIQVFEPFSILRLEPGASDSEIKKAYRRLSVQYHPDKNSDPDWRFTLKSEIETKI
ncbi:hypothetical protein GQ457_13G014710 [Hibiscus cannabinus]